MSLKHTAFSSEAPALEKTGTDGQGLMAQSFPAGPALVQAQESQVNGRSRVKRYDSAPSPAEPEAKNPRLVIGGESVHGVMYRAIRDDHALRSSDLGKEIARVLR